MSHPETAPAESDHRWYKYGVGVLIGEMILAIGVCAYSLFMAFSGMGGFPGK